MKLADILPDLTRPFEAAEHKERKLPGGGTWWFIPWQTIRDRLNEVCPEDWTAEYSDPVVAAEHVVIRCTLTICGVARTGVGNDKAYPDKQTYGTPIERAVADAFKAAAEAFNIAAYLDDQSQGKREFTIRYLQSKGDGRGLKAAAENGWIPGNLNPEKQADRRQQQAASEVAQIRKKAGDRTITEPQISRLTTLAKKAGYTDGGLRQLVYGYGFQSRKDITITKYEEICIKAQDAELAAAFNQSAAVQAS